MESKYSNFVTFTDFPDLRSLENLSLTIKESKDSKEYRVEATKDKTKYNFTFTSEEKATDFYKFLKGEQKKGYDLLNIDDKFVIPKSKYLRHDCLKSYYYTTVPAHAIPNFIIRIHYLNSKNEEAQFEVPFAIEESFDRAKRQLLIDLSKA